MLTVLAKTLDSQGILSYDAGMNILNAFTPSGDVQQAGAARRGTQRAEGRPVATSSPTNVARESAASGQTLTGMNPQQEAVSNFIAQNLHGATMTDQQRAELVSRTATGLNIGDATLSGTLGALPANEQDQRARITAGTAMSAAQDANNQATWGNLRQGERGLIQQGALGEINAGINATQAAGQAAAAKAAAERSGGSHVAQLLESKKSLLTSIKSSKDPMTSTLIKSYIGALNGINQQLQAAGVPTEGVIPDSDQLLRPGVFNGLVDQALRFMQSKP